MRSEFNFLIVIIKILRARQFLKHINTKDNLEMQQLKNIKYKSKFLADKNEEIKK